MWYKSILKVIIYLSNFRFMNFKRAVVCIQSAANESIDLDLIRCYSFKTTQCFSLWGFSGAAIANAAVLVRYNHFYFQQKRLCNIV